MFPPDGLAPEFGFTRIVHPSCWIGTHFRIFVSLRNSLKGSMRPAARRPRIAAMRPQFAVLSLLAVSMAALAVPPQSPNEPPQPAAPPSKVERVEVRVAQFDVVVRDKQGKIVTGLRPEDFTVLEDGTPLEVVAVDEWGAETVPAPAAAASPPPPSPAGTADAPAVAPPAPAARETPAEPERRSVLFVFDGMGESTAVRMNQARKAAQRFVENRMTDQDLGAVYQLDLSLRPMTGITANRAELKQGIAKVTWMPPSSLKDQIAESVAAYAMQGNQSVMQSRLAGMAANAGDELDWTRERVYKNLQGLADVFQAMPGRRVLVLVSAGFPMSTVTDRTRQRGGFTPAFRDLIRGLARAGVTVYSLDVGNDIPIGDAGQTIDWRIAVGKLGMDENVLADLGLETGLDSSSASSRREFLGVIAAETGGRMLTSTNLDSSFETIQEETTRFYRIACRVSVVRGGERYRRIVVTAKRPGLVVSGRRGRYSDLTPVARPDRSGPSHVVDAIDRYLPFPLRGIALPLPGTDPKKVPVAVVVEALGPLEFSTDPAGAAAIDVEFRVVARVEGEVVDRYERSFTAKVKPEGVAAIRSGWRIEGALSLLPGIYELQATARLASPPRLGSWTASVTVPPPSRGQVPAVSGVVLASERVPQAPLLSRPTLAEETDPLAIKPGSRLLPPTSSDFELGDTLLALFWLKGMDGDNPEVPKLDLSLKVSDAEERQREVPSTLVYFGKDPSGGYRGLARLDVSALPAGPYVLRVSAAPKGTTSPPAVASTRFALQSPAGAPAKEITSSSGP